MDKLAMKLGYEEMMGKIDKNTEVEECQWWPLCGWLTTMHWLDKRELPVRKGKKENEECHTLESLIVVSDIGIKW